jgi:hypothetical protein
MFALEKHASGAIASSFSAIDVWENRVKTDLDMIQDEHWQYPAMMM